MHQNEQLVIHFYKAFNNKDFKAMAACYHAEATFYDPVFLHLKGKQINAMWHMLCENAKDFEIILKDAQADDFHGVCHWEAKYVFSGTGKKVHNKITSVFQFKDGLIISQKDSFDLYKWSRMAMGFVGVVAGWLPSVKEKIRTKAGKGLNKFIGEHSEYQQ